MQGYDHSLELWRRLFIQNLLYNLRGFLRNDEFNLQEHISQHRSYREGKVKYPVDKVLAGNR